MFAQTVGFNLELKLPVVNSTSVSRMSIFILAYDKICVNMNVIYLHFIKICVSFLILGNL